MQSLKHAQAVKDRNGNGFEITVGFTGNTYIKQMIRFGDTAEQTAAAFREFAATIENMKELK